MKRLVLLLFVIIIISSIAVVAQKCPLYATEGDLLDVNVEGYDPDPEIGPAGRLIWGYPAPFDTNGLWQTRVGDQGVYHFTFSLSDGEFTDSYKTCLELFPLHPVTVRPQQVREHNNPPVLFGVKDVDLYVGETLDLHLSCMDIDGDDVEIIYYGWPGQLSHLATIADVGTQVAEVVCRDSRGAETRQRAFYNVKARSSAPGIALDHIIVYEGDTVDLTDYLYDMDNDITSLRYSATGIFQNSLVWHTQRGDRGNYTTRLSVSDGQTLVVRDILVEVLEYVPFIYRTSINYSDLPQLVISDVEHLPVYSFDDVDAVEEEIEDGSCTPCDCPEDYSFDVISEPDYLVELRMPVKRDPCGREIEQLQEIKEPNYPIFVQAEPDYPVEVREPIVRDPCGREIEQLKVVMEPDYPVEVREFVEKKEEINCGEEKEVAMWSSEFKHPCTNYII